jgi:tetratricopeptide (TPR) repeat protein
MSTELVRVTPESPSPLSSLSSAPLVPWRDPQTVSPQEIQAHIAKLEAACLEQPKSADLRTCLGMAYAVNYEVNKSMDALELAVQLDPEHFWGQLKLGELHYRLRALKRAETETARAVDLARNPWELNLARRQLQEIRRLSYDGARNITWDKPLAAPVAVLVAMMAVIFAVMLWT